MGSSPTSDHLMASLDVLRFTLAYAALVLIPGYCLATLTLPAWRRIERFALAIPCAYAMVAVSGLATALLHLPYGLPAYAVLAVPATLAGASTAWHNRGERATEEDRWWLLPVGAMVAEFVAISLAYAQDFVPTGWDAAVHASWVNLIARAHVFPIALLSANLGANDGGFYPPAFHVLDVLVLDIVPMPAYRVVFYGVVATVVVMPVALFAYVRTATGSSRLGGLAALAALAFEPFPFFAIGQGGLYTFSASLLIVPTLAMALRDALGDGDRRAVALSGLLGIGLFYTHPTEFITAALLALAIVPGRLRDARSWLRACGNGAIIAAIWGLAAAPALASVHQTMAGAAQGEIRGGHFFAPSPQVHLDAVFGLYLHWVYASNLSYLLLVAVVAGIAWCLVQRRWLGLVVAQAILFAIFVDANTYNVLQRFYVLSFPWALWYRLVDTHYLVALPLAAIGTDALARLVRRILHARDPVFMGILATPVVVFGLVFPLAVAMGRATHYAQLHRVVAPADIGAMSWLAHHSSAQTAVVNDGDLRNLPYFDVPSDAGLWIPIAGGPQPLFWNAGTGPGNLQDRLYVLRHIADDPLPRRAARFVDQYDVRYVFYGSGLRSNATRHLNLAKLLADPRLHLLYSSAASCRGRGTSASACPPGASYIFALAGVSYPHDNQMARERGGHVA